MFTPHVNSDLEIKAAKSLKGIRLTGSFEPSFHLLPKRILTMTHEALLTVPKQTASLAMKCCSCLPIEESIALACSVAVDNVEI